MLYKHFRRHLRNTVMFVNEDDPPGCWGKLKYKQTAEAGMPMKRLELLSVKEMQGPEQGMAVSQIRRWV